LYAPVVYQTHLDELGELLAAAREHGQAACRVSPAQFVVARSLAQPGEPRPSRSSRSALRPDGAMMTSFLAGALRCVVCATAASISRSLRLCRCCQFLSIY
jgi:hypothetical protein